MGCTNHLRVLKIRKNKSSKIPIANGPPVFVHLQVLNQNIRQWLMTRGLRVFFPVPLQSSLLQQDPGYINCRVKRGREERKKVKFSKHTKKNKAGYTATPVACGWAGAIFEISGAFGQERYSQKTHKRRKSKVWWMDGPMDGPMDGQTNKVGCRVA